MLIDKLDDLVHNARQLRLRDQVRVDRQKVHDILDQMRATIPEDVKQARWIVKERQEMLAAAKHEAERIVEEAGERQSQLVSEHELTRQAERAADEILDGARASASSALAPWTTPTRSSTHSRSTSRGSLPPSGAAASVSKAPTSPPTSGNTRDSPDCSGTLPALVPRRASLRGRLQPAQAERHLLAFERDAPRRPGRPRRARGRGRSLRRIASRWQVDEVVLGEPALAPR
jgi:vacuolar-type H+-ATPase subunit H